MDDTARAARLKARFDAAAEEVFLHGSTQWEVDEALEAFGFSIGPFEAQDILGLDKAWANQQAHGFGAATAHVPLSERMLELGKLGRSTGAGWYRYPGGGPKVDDPIVADLAIEESHYARITRDDYSPDEICERILMPLIQEAALMMETGAPADQIDAVVCAAIAFPAAKIGPLAYADHLGLRNVETAMRRLGLTPPRAITQSAKAKTPLTRWPSNP